MTDLSPLGDLMADWRRHGACVGVGEDGWWLYDENDQIPDGELGKLICDTCSVRVECHDDDMKYGYAGIRGGVDDHQKAAIVRHRKRYLKYYKYDLGPALRRVEKAAEEARQKLEEAA